MKIYKYILTITGRQAVAMPRGAKLLDVQVQRDDWCLWVLCDETAPTELRHIAIYSTGYPIPGDPGEYIGTFQPLGGTVVFHAFDAGVEP